MALLLLCKNICHLKLAFLTFIFLIELNFDFNIFADFLFEKDAICIQILYVFPFIFNA